jgi:hypothetical protein
MSQYRWFPGADIWAVIIAVALMLFTLGGSLALVYSARHEYEAPLSFRDVNGRRHILNGPHGSRSR